MEELISKELKKILARAFEEGVTINLETREGLYLEVSGVIGVEDNEILLHS